MKVRMIRFTPDADALGGEAAALCTGFEGDSIKAMRNAVARGHQSIIEHASFTFRVEDVSRVLLAQLTRHRIASFSVQSQRYCGVEPEWIVPQTIIGAGFEDDYRDACQNCYMQYLAWVDNDVPEEDARFVIPQGVACNLLVTMNARELLHFFELRCCNRAQWEIREMADLMLEECGIAAPEIFKHAGAPCQQGRSCPEGKFSCGKPREVRRC